MLTGALFLYFCVSLSSVLLIFASAPARDKLTLLPLAKRYLTVGLIGYMISLWRSRAGYGGAGVFTGERLLVCHKSWAGDFDYWPLRTVGVMTERLPADTAGASLVALVTPSF